MMTLHGDSQEMLSRLQGTKQLLKVMWYAGLVEAATDGLGRNHSQA